ncbi:MAG TPA: hypothetical protein VHX52_12035 [Steroidobacteraceae bacterium]|jgi:hypothetical protein|nr:hypothetical protein [Steroidobacteraceae bacterium]
MKMLNRMTLLGAMTVLLSLWGCVVRGPYTYNHGDRIDRFGHHDVGWCGHHGDDPNCHR